MNIYCVGDNNVDIYLDQNKVYPGGCCLNVSAYAGMLGHRAAFVSTVGNDRLGQLQYQAVQSLGVDVGGVHVIDGQTGWCFIELDHNDRVFSKWYNGAKEKCPVSAEDVRKGQTGEFDLLYTSLEAFYEEGALEQFAKSPVPAFCDLSTFWTEETLKTYCGYFNYVALSGPDLGVDRLQQLLKTCTEYGADLAIGTMGLKGSFVFNGRKMYYQKACPVRAVDTLGAGDSYLTAFITSYIEGKKRLAPVISALAGERGALEAFREYEDVLIQQSMSLGALFSAKNCMHYGAIGHETDFDPAMIREGL